MRLYLQTMRLFFVTLILGLPLLSYSQTQYTGHKGSKLFPFHVDIVISVDSAHIRYEVFHHWYSVSYAELRQINIPTDSLAVFNSSQDTLQILFNKKYVLLDDKTLGISQKIRHGKLCTSADRMRKISFAYAQSSKHTGIQHFHLYKNEDLELSEEEFRKVVLNNLRLKLKS